MDLQIRAMNELELGNSEKELVLSAVNALQKSQESFKVWNRSHSDFTWKNITIGGEYTPLRRLRQISAELARKRDALVEAKYEYLKRVQMSKVKQEEAQEETKLQKKDYLLIEAAEYADKAKMMEKSYIGCAKDVIELGNLYEHIKKQLIVKYGKFDEEVFEKEEARYWVKRSFAQSLRDIRERGCITKGEQELLEQIGLDPQIVSNLLREFIRNNETNKNTSSAKLEVFLEKCADTYSEGSFEKMKRLGFSTEIDSSHLYLAEKE